MLLGGNRMQGSEILPKALFSVGGRRETTPGGGAGGQLWFEIRRGLLASERGDSKR